ncbi:MAG: penicillin-binding protein 2 [Candidatus Uhrbacteria bacterium]|nr:penicillin-binding protein 2 [Candidatus Uhrbacteria bacterium]
MKPSRKPWQQQTGTKREWRIEALRSVFLFFAGVIVLKLFIIQVVEHENYAALASGQHEIFQKLYPERGQVFVHDGNELIPVVTNQQLAFVYADPRYIKDAKGTADTIASILLIDDEHKAALETKFANSKDPYEPIQHKVPKETLDRITVLKLPGILFTMEPTRLYPESNMGGQILGFLGSDKDGKQKGRYGIEGFFDQELSGTQGFLKSDHDIAGNIIAVADHSLTPAKNGSDVVLTLDRTIQYKACSTLAAVVLRHGADSGSIVIVDPKTGRILAMCGAPDFDPNHFGDVKDANTFNDPAIFDAYEPGSIFKTIAMAAGIDSGAVTPETTFTDTGTAMVDGWPKPIKNAIPKPYGLINMTNVLEQSVNTGMIFTMRKTTPPVLDSYIKKFGFGKQTGIELERESAGNIKSIDQKSEIFQATASFGQGLRNGGVLKKPYIVDEIRHPDGTVDKRSPQDVAQVISAKSSRTLGAMLVSVVEHGEGHAAGVKGYYIGGKTGTAQVPSPNGGYELNNTIGSFAGFGPVEDPKFAMIVRINHPRDVQWAESTAAPFFGDMAKFLLQYFEVPPTRK